MHFQPWQKIHVTSGFLCSCLHIRAQLVQYLFYWFASFCRNCANKSMYVPAHTHLRAHAHTLACMHKDGCTCTPGLSLTFNWYQTSTKWQCPHSFSPADCVALANYLSYLIMKWNLLSIDLDQALDSIWHEWYRAIILCLKGYLCNRNYKIKDHAAIYTQKIMTFLCHDSYMQKLGKDNLKLL